jgi:hypothetical protein
MSQSGVDGQSVHLETECHSSKLSQQTVRRVDASRRVVGLSVDGSSRHHYGAGMAGCQMSGIYWSMWDLAEKQGLFAITVEGGPRK